MAGRKAVNAARKVGGEVRRRPASAGKADVRHVLAAASAELESLADSLDNVPHLLRLLDEHGGEMYRVGRGLHPGAQCIFHAAPIRGPGGIHVGSIEVQLARGSERALAVALCEQVTRAVERGISLRQASRQAGLLSELDHLEDAALPAADVTSVMNKIVAGLREMFQVDTAAILVISESGRHLVVRAASGLERELDENVTIPIERGIAGRIAASRTPVIIDKVSQVEAVSPSLPERVSSLMGTALVSEGRILGVVHLGSAQPRRFTEGDARQLQIIADRLAHAIDHARLSRAERAARSEAERAERRFRDLVQNLDAIVWEANARTWRYTFVSRRAEKMLGYPLQKWLEEPDFWAMIVHPDDRDDVIERRRRAIEQARSMSSEYRVIAADGRTMWVRSLFDVVRDSNGVPVQLRGLMLDITQRRQAEEAALRLAAIVEGSEDAIIGKDLRGTITDWNRGAEKMYGYTAEEVLGRPIAMLEAPESHGDINGIMRKLRDGEHITHHETKRVRKDGEQIEVALTISPIRNPEGKIIGASTIARDITEIKRAERTLRMTEKLAATGRLAASIAHEINNPMASVTNLLYLLEHHTAIDDAAREYVRLAEEELGRVTHIVRQMLGFYRESDVPVMVSLKDVVGNVLRLYSRRIVGAHIEVRTRYDSEGTVRAFPGEMRQVFSNLITNAIEAMGEDGQLQIHVREGRDWSRPEVRGIRIIVSDSGPGIQPEARRRMFEPFFTTKGERGTGLGLWVTDGIVRKHNGTLRLRTTTGPHRHGTCFSIFLPFETFGRTGSIPAAA